MTDIHCLLLSIALTFLMIFVASQLRSRAWTPAGAKLAFGNREALPEPSAIAGRADRAAKNMLENLVLFLAVFVAARLAGAPPSDIVLGAQIFFFARVLYFFAYLLGIPYVRTFLWLTGVLGMILIGLAAARA
ncbi:MAPEG family protein [soil metagenome]